jgi:hypothetical protein
MLLSVKFATFRETGKREEENMLQIFERRILRRIYGPIKENGIWRSRYNHELYKLYNEADVVKVIIVKWL